MDDDMLISKLKCNFTVIIVHNTKKILFGTSRNDERKVDIGAIHSAFFGADSKAEAIECADSQGIILDFEERAFQDRVGIVLTEGEEGFIDEVFKLFFRYGKSSMTLNFWHSRVSRTVATHDLEGSVAAGQGDDEFIIAGEFNIAVRHTMDDRDDLRVGDDTAFIGNIGVNRGFNTFFDIVALEGKFLIFGTQVNAV